ncbi:MAG: SAM-dependent methyltransferase, partial [Dehalococcoidia bacterium]|nr:SAM-dependent methyltransferase [Dehalococcoidia bacterium]
MKEGKASLTAELAAAVRAAEAMKPASERTCYDPLARRLLGPVLRQLARSRLLVKVILWAAERIAPGVPDEVIARTRYIDDRLEACIGEGISQLVILGAGYDSRPYRFEDIGRTVRVFELDHPATQELKTRRVKKICGCLPSYVKFIPLDFDQETLDSK